jgi:glycosyltransferase involved in cell wall biosynthesis
MSQSVSVIVTCFNLERYIGEAIQSVLDQQLDRPFEIIVVDDCSTDASAKIARSFPNVRNLRTTRNSGVMLAMLEGIRLSSGELLFFLDGDDVWEDGKLARCVRAFDEDPSRVLVTHDLRFIDQNGRQLDRQSRPNEVLGSMPVNQQGRAVIDGILNHRDFVWLGSAFGVRRSLGNVQEFDVWVRALPDPANTYQDWPLAFWVSSLPGVSAAYIPDRLFSYRLHQANYSGDASSAERAARNFLRARNTLAAMAGLANDRRLPSATQETLQSRARAYAYLTKLYGGYRIEALSAFRGAALSFAKRNELPKELIRLAGVLLLGPELFARRAARRR